MGIEELKERVRALAGGSKDKAVLVRVARQLRDEGVNPREILKAIKEETGVGLSLRTTFKKDGKNSVERKTARSLERRIGVEIASEATRNINEMLATGKSLEEALGPIAKNHGYEKTSDFVMKTFDFWSTYKDYVDHLYVECGMYKATIRHLVDLYSPQSMKILRANAVWNFCLQLAKVMGGKLPPDKTLMVMIEAIQNALG